MDKEFHDRFDVIQKSINDGFKETSEGIHKVDLKVQKATDKVESVQGELTDYKKDNGEDIQDLKDADKWIVNLIVIIILLSVAGSVGYLVYAEVTGA